MTILLTLIHVFVCFFLILVVLLQTGKGADVAAAFGGSSQTAFGARGASTLLSKMTTISAIVFMLTSLILALFSSGPSKSVLEDAPGAQSPPASSAPATPGKAPAPEAGAPGGAAPATPTPTPGSGGGDAQPGGGTTPSPAPSGGGGF